MSNRNRNGRSVIETTANQMIDTSNREVEHTLFGNIRASETAKKQFGLVPSPDGTVQAGSFQLTATGIDIDHMAYDVSEDEWRSLGEMLIKLEGSIQWLIGDWLIIGERLFKHGDVAEMANKFDFEPEYFYDLKSVALAIPYANRIHNLSHGHHRAVRAIPKQREWLLTARSNGWSVAELRKQIKLAINKSLPEKTIPVLADSIYPDTAKRIAQAVKLQKLDKITGDDIRLIKEWIAQVELLLMDG